MQPSPSSQDTRRAQRPRISIPPADRLMSYHRILPRPTFIFRSRPLPTSRRPNYTHTYTHDLISHNSARRRALTFKTPTFANTGSTARDHLASERTFLAWLRTGLGFVALGIAVERFSQLELTTATNSPPAPFAPSTPSAPSSNQIGRPARSLEEVRASAAREEILVAVLLGVGTGAIAYGMVRYFSNLHLLQRGLFKPAYHGAAGAGIMVAGIAGTAYGSAIREHVRGREARKAERKKDVGGR